MAKNKKLWIDMCAGSELKDTQGETLSVDGANIEELAQGRGRFNDNHGKGFFNSLGRVTEAKKIFKAEDCENERHEYYWNKIKAPYVYCKGYLYSDEDHPNARAAAAIIKNIHREDSPLRMKASVEGGVLSRGIKDPTRLARTKIHSVALTFTPANNATLVEPLNVDKSDVNWAADKQLIKSVMHLAQDQVPSFRHIQRHASANTIHENIYKIQELAKSLGVEIEVKNSDPEKIMKSAVMGKIASNIVKINELVKASNNSNLMNVMKPQASSVTPTFTSPGKVQMADQEKKAGQLKARDSYQQKIGQLKNDPTVPQTPKPSSAPKGAMKVQGADKVKSMNVLKGHASKAMKDPAHLNMVKQSLVDRGIDEAKVNKVLNSIKSHMQQPIQKSEIEKGDIKNALKGLAAAGVLAVGADSMGPKNIPNKPKEERSIASQDKKKKKEPSNPDLIIGSKGKGYDERQPNAKDSFKEKMKGKLKKALMAGYGGAGAPTSTTGGGVLQPESLERKTKKADSGELDYISCDNCGHEQVHMKHQVKCRKCRKNFSLEKLDGYV